MRNITSDDVIGKIGKPITTIMAVLLNQRIRSVMISINSITCTSLFSKSSEGPLFWNIHQRHTKYCSQSNAIKQVTRMINKPITKLMFFHSVKEGWVVWSPGVIPLHVKKFSKGMSCNTYTVVEENVIVVHHGGCNNKHLMTGPEGNSEKFTVPQGTSH